MNRRTEKKVNAIVNEILHENQNDFGATRTETCPGGCEKLDDEVSYAQGVSLLHSQLF